jgi:methyl-accepting chemotaxis protein
LTFFYPEATLRPRSERQEIKEIVAEVMKEAETQKEDPLDRIADDVGEISRAVNRIAATIKQMKKT